MNGERVLATGLDVTFRFNAGQELTISFPNNQTGTGINPVAGQVTTFVPITGQFFGGDPSGNRVGTFFGDLLGHQPAFGVGGIFSLAFAQIPGQGFSATTTYQDRSVDKSRLPQGSVSGPFEVASIPEPTTLALMAIGLAGMGFRRRQTH